MARVVINLRLLSAVIVCIMVATAPHAQAAINCGVITENLAPCIGFLESSQGPSPACCRGVKTLQALAVSVEDRRTACRCMKSAAAAFPGINPKNTVALPGKCGVSLTVAVSPKTDCSKVS